MKLSASNHETFSRVSLNFVLIVHNYKLVMQAAKNRNIPEIKRLAGGTVSSGRKESRDCGALNQ